MLDLAAAGNLQLADAADIATNVLSAYGMQVSEIGTVSDMLAVAAANSNSNIYDLAEAMKNVGPLAHTAGISLRDTIKYLMTLSKSAIRGGEAGTLMMNAFRMSAAFTKQGIKLLSKYGIQYENFIDETGRLKDFDKLLSLIGQHKIPVGALFKIFDIRGGKAVAVLKDQTEELVKFNKILTDSHGAAQRMAAVLMSGAPVAVKKFTSALEGLKLTMAAFILPMFTTVTEKFANFFSHLAADHPVLLKFSAIMLSITAVLGALIVPMGLVIISLGAIMTAFSAMSAPVIALAGAIGALVIAYRKWGDSGTPIINAIKGVASAINDLFAPGLILMRDLFVSSGMAGGFFKGVINAITSAVVFSVKSIEIMIRTLTLFVRIIGTIGNVIGAALTGNFSGAVAALKAGGRGMLSDLSKIDIAGRDAASAITMRDISSLKAAAKTSVDMQGQITVEAAKGTTVQGARVSAGGQNLGVNVREAGLAPAGY
jgi:TP901 family phage tail tape measure protein